MQQKSDRYPLNYQTVSPATSKPTLWIVSVALGFAQYPWIFHWMRAIGWDRDGQSVMLLHDSLYRLAALALTFPALGTGIICLYRNRQTKSKRVLLTCPVVVAVSMFLIAVVVSGWYSDIFRSASSGPG